MNALGFLRLLRKIYGREKPDLDWIQSQGLLAVKIAQHYALRVDFLDQEVCHHLAQLFRQAQSIPPENVMRLLRERVPDAWFDSVRDFDENPVAAASVGQVHRAVHRDGTPLAVKIIKKDFKTAFLSDLRRIRALMHFVLFFYPKLRKVFDPVGVLEHIEDYTMNELDLRNEIEGQQILQAIADQSKDRYDLSLLRFARVYPDLSREGVLVSEFVDGHTFDELLEHGTLTYDQLLQLFSIHGFFLFAPGTFHGDIHPGNIMLRKDNTICLLDTGAISHVGEKIRRGLFRFFVALSEYDYPTSARRINEMADVGISGTRFNRFESQFLDLYADFKDSSVSEISLTRKMMETIKLAVNCGMVFEKGMFAIIKSMMYLDGMVLRCKPDAVLMRDMRPFIKGFEKVLKEFNL